MFQVINDIEQATKLNAAGLLWVRDPHCATWAVMSPWMERHRKAGGLESTWRVLLRHGHEFAILLED